MNQFLLSPLCGDFQSNSGIAANLPEGTLRCLANDSRTDYVFPLEEIALPLAHFQRDSRLGAKAGNLNHALTCLLAQSESESQTEPPLPSIFLLLDSDGRLADPEQLAGAEERLLSVAPGAEAPCFLQTRQAGNPAQTGFPGIMAPWVEMHFDTMVAFRGWNPGGFRMFYGHGAFIPVAVWEQCREAGRAWRAAGEAVEPGDGGFPEIVTEDLAFTLRCRELGLRGEYLPDVTCYEDFPETYGQLRKRTDKWIRGTGQCLGWYWRRRWRHWGLWWRGWAGVGQTLLSVAPDSPLDQRRLTGATDKSVCSTAGGLTGATDKNVCSTAGVRHRPGLGPWEIFDLTVHAVQHALAVPMLALAVYTCVVLPTRLAQARPILGYVAQPIMDGKLWWKWLTEVRVETNWTPELFLFLLSLTVIPLLPAVRRLWKTPVHLVKFIGVSIFLSLAGLVAETLSVVTFLLSGQAHFRVTGDKSEGLGVPGNTAAPGSDSGPQGSQGTAFSRWRLWIGAYHPNSPWVFVVEAAAGAWFCWKGYELKCLWSYGPGVALLTSPLFHYLGWKNLAVRVLIAVPAILLFLMMILTWRTVFGNRLW